MRPIDITQEAVLSYLQDQGITEAQIFGTEQARLDPIDRHIALRDLYVHFTEFRMTNEGLTYTDPKHKCQITISNMRDFDRIDTLEDCVVNMKYIGYVKESRIHLPREQKTQRVRKDQEYER